MSAPLLAICDPDITYSTQLLRYLEERRDFPYVVRLFSSYLLCRQALQSQAADLLLLSVDCCPPGEENFPAKKVLLFGDPTKAGSANMPVVDKYQPVTAVTRELVFHATGPVTKDEAEEACHILGVYAPFGACLKTSLAMSFALLLSRTRQSLYLNLEDVAGLVDFFPQPRGDLSDLLYYLRADPDRALSCFGEIKSGLSSLTLLPPPQNAFDLYDTSEALWRDLLHFLATEAACSAIVLDLGNGLGKLPFFLSLCEKIYLPARKETRANKKLSAFRESLPHLASVDLASRLSVVELPRERLPALSPAQLPLLADGPLGALAKECLLRDGLL